MRSFIVATGVALIALATLTSSVEAASKKKTPPKTADTPKKEKMVTTPSGLKYEDIVVGTGDTPKTGQAAFVDYTGWLESGKKFDSNIDPEFKHVKPFKFLVGQHQVIAGWDEGVGSMKVGGKRKLTIPPALGYGAKDVGNGLIPPNSTLIFEVELKSLQ